MVADFVLGPGGPVDQPRHITSHEELSARICEALGIDSTEVGKVRIFIEPGGIATVEVEFHINAVSGELIGAYFKEYELVERGKRGKK